MKELISTIVCVAIATQTFSQLPRIKDDPINRVAYELQKLQNPQTGKIPKGIRAKEIQFVESQKSLFRLAGANTTWNHRGPFNVGGRTRALAVDINNEDVILAGGVSGGLWRTTDGGTTWTKRTEISDLQSITCIAQDPRPGQTNTWYYGTGELFGNSASGSGAFFLGDGIYKSTDNGLTWTVLSSTVSNSPESLNSGSFEVNNEMVVNPTNGDILVADFFGIQRSENGGTSFSQVLSNTFQGWSDIVVTSGGILYAALEGRGIFKSVDNGDNWTNITDSGFPTANGARIELGLAPSAEDTLYVITTISQNPTDLHELWMYDDNDGGVSTWVDRSNNIPSFGGNVGDFDSQSGYDLLVAVKPDDPDFVVIGGTNLYRSTDGFATSSSTNDWIGGYSPRNNISSYDNQHPDQHAFLFLSGNKALSGNDGGVQMTNDITDEVDDIFGDGKVETVDWISLNNGYLTTQVYAVSVGPGEQIMSGFQDNSTFLTTSSTGTEPWSDQFSGDGSYNAFNNDGTVRYVSAQNAIIYRSLYSNANSEVSSGFTRIDPSPSLGYPDRNNNESVLFITPFYLDPLDENLLYLGGDELLFVNTQAASATQTSGWKSIELSGNTGVVSEFGLTTANTVYVGTSNGRVYRVDNPESSSPNVEEVTGSNFPSNAYVSSIGVNQYNEDELIVVFSNYEVPSIFYSNDGGLSWTDIGGNLEENSNGSGSGPSVRAARIVDDGFEYLVGTSTGLYSTGEINGTSTVWTQEGTTNIGNVVINHLVTRDDGLVVIGTHGNGIYSADIGPDIDMGVAAPSDILLSSQSIDEGSVIGSLVGSLTSTDEDDTSHAYSLVSGDGDDDNQSFSISSTNLVSSEVFDFNAQSDFTIRIQTSDDDGNTFAKSFSIEVNDVLGLEDLENSGITMFPNPFKSRVTLEMVNDYFGEIKMKVLSIDGQKVVIEKTYDKRTKTTQSLIELKDLASGIYLIEFGFGGQLLTGKLIKE